MSRMIGATLIALWAATCARAESFVDVWGGEALSGHIYVSETQAATTFDRHRYRISARLRTERFGDAVDGTREEYSAALTRELYHVTVTGRLGTSPPNSQRASYHLVGGEAWFTFYGLTLGPEHPELSLQIWESSGSAPAPESLDSTWVTRIGGIYSNINNHLEGTLHLPTIVENVWQLDVSETYRRATTLGIQVGFDRLNQVLGSQSHVTVKDNIYYPGNKLPIAGWPNNWVGLKLSQKVGPVAVTAAATRLNLLNNALQIFYSAGLSWELESGLSLQAGYEHKRARGNNTREGLWLGTAYRW